MATHLRDFTEMNPPMFFGSIFDEDPQDFLDEEYKILFTLGVSTIEKKYLAAYQLKDVAQTWYNQWKDSWDLEGGPITWDIFKNAFLDIFHPREQRESKVENFINILKEGMSVKEYSLMFINLSKYASSLVSNDRDEISW